jgi:hypothetical protein
MAAKRVMAAGSPWSGVPSYIEATEEAMRSQAENQDGLRELSALDGEALAERYWRAQTPTLDEMVGDFDGRMLAAPPLRGALGALWRTVVGSELFPWRGKSFSAPTATGERGDGVNRVFTDRWRAFRFATYLARSRAGDFDALHIDYDLPTNPFFVRAVRAVRDEIRRVGPGVYLGQSYLVLRGAAGALLCGRPQGAAQVTARM